MVTMEGRDGTMVAHLEEARMGGGAAIVLQCYTIRAHKQSNIGEDYVETSVSFLFTSSDP